MTPRTLELREYESGSVALPDGVARRLAQLADGALTVTPTAEAGRWNLTAANCVGTLDLPGVRVLIRPKVELENLLVLLDIGMPDNAWQPGEFSYSSRPDLLEVFVSFFARALEELSVRGLHRSYQQRSDLLVALRGRIDFPTQIKGGILPAPVACTFDDYTLDIPENRYLLGVTDHLLRIGSISLSTRALLRHAGSRFEGVIPALPTAAEIDALHLTRLNEHYRPALRLARLIVQNLTISDEIGGHSADTFLLDMNKVFEGFVTRRLRAALRGRLQVLDQTTRHLGLDRKVRIYPDLEFRRDDETVFVGDVKYKLADSGQARSSDYFQLLAYCTVLGLDQGVLIYAQSDDGDVDHNLAVVNSGHRLTTYRLNLAGSPADLEESVARLATWITNQV